MVKDFSAHCFAHAFAIVTSPNLRLVISNPYQFFIVENVVEVHCWRHFKAWLSELEALGYQVVPLCLNSMFFGTPQSRDRVFFFGYQKHLPTPNLHWHPLAYCPQCQQPVNAVQSWKKPHQQYGKYRAQYLYRCPTCMEQAYPYVRGANTIIDWSLPIHSVGDRSNALFCKRHKVRPLKPKTRERIGVGLKAMSQRFVIDTAYDGISGKVKDNQVPLPTQTSRQTLGVVQAPVFLSTLRSGRPRNQDLDLPLATCTSTNNYALVAPPFIATLRGTEHQQTPADSPISTITSVNHHALVIPSNQPQVVCGKRGNGSELGGRGHRSHALLSMPSHAHLLTYHNHHGWHPIGMPTTTQTSKERHALVLPNGTELNLDDSTQLEQAIDLCGFRMLTWQEARLGMAFPASYRLTSSKEKNFAVLGQAVTPPVVPWMIERALEAWS